MDGKNAYRAPDTPTWKYKPRVYIGTFGPIPNRDYHQLWV